MIELILRLVFCGCVLYVGINLIRYIICNSEKAKRKILGGYYREK